MNRICKSLINGSGSSLLSQLCVIKNFTTNANHVNKQLKLASTCSNLLTAPRKLALSSQLYRNFYSTETALDDDDGYEKRQFKPRQFGGSRFEEPRSFGGDRGGGFKSNRFGGGGGGGGGRKFGGRDQGTSSTLDDFADSEQVESTGDVISHTSGQATFANYNIPAPLLERLNQLGYKNPFQIQTETLEHTLAGKDVVGKAFTGSGKTLAFAIPIISRIMNSENASSPYPKCLVLSPTRELCLQLTKTISELAPQMKCVAVYGGAGMNEQMYALGRKVDVVCATPGRLRDLMQRSVFKTDNIELICLDEADELLTPNFLDQIKDIIEISNKKQMLMFSATINKNVIGIVKRYMDNPVVIDLTQGQKFKLPTNIEHFIHSGRVDPRSQPMIVGHYLKKFQSDRCIVFVNRKADANALSSELKRMGIRSTEFHSDISQNSRERLLAKFRRGELNVLIATDVAARGIDIPEINLIIHLGAPMTIDAYIHRSGRTGRAGRTGSSVLISDGSSQGGVLSDLERVIKFKPTERVDLSQMRSAQPPSQRYDDNEDEVEYVKPRYESREPRGYSSGGYGRPQQSRRFNNDSDDYESRSSYRR